MKNSSKTDGCAQQVPRLAVRVANGVFILCFLYSIYSATHAVVKIYNNPDSATPPISYICLLIFLFVATLFAFALRRLNDGIKVNLSVLIMTTSISVYAFEICLDYRKYVTNDPVNRHNDRITIAKKMGVYFDSRTKVEVINDLKGKGVNAYPGISPTGLWSNHLVRNGLDAADGKIFQLGGVANITTVYGNEGGHWMV